jgi:hypothetical protein
MNEHFSPVLAHASFDGFVASFDGFVASFADFLLH